MQLASKAGLYISPYGWQLCLAGLYLSMTASFAPAWAQTANPPAEAPAEGQTEIQAEATSSDVPPELRLLSPTPAEILDVPAATIILQVPPHSQVELKVNGQPVSDQSIGQTHVDPTGLVTQSWYGVSLQAGENQITVEGWVNGKQARLQSTVVVRGAATDLSLEPISNGLPADGRSQTTIQGQLLDENGNRSNYSAVITLTSSRGQFLGEDQSPTQPGFQVKAQNGQFTAQLQAPVQAGTATIQATSTGLEAFTQLQFHTHSRPSLVSGVVDLRLGQRGLNFFDRLDEFRLNRDSGWEVDSHAALFATGSIGEWLFTGAYNSDRPLNKRCDCNNNLNSGEDQFTDSIYPVYGDSSTFNRLTPSQDHFYVRLERTSQIPGAAPDFALWGDYSSSEFATRSQEFTAITRQLHGAKLNYNFGDLQLTGFFGNNVQGFQRDILAPDGTAGFYFLSQRLVLPGSETVFLELEELERPGTLVERIQLTRGQDYDIDYDRGTLRFREAILRTTLAEDGRILLRRIVATYQHEAGEDTSIYGLRARYHLNRELQQESWLGATALLENQGSRDFSLYGVDALFSLGDRGQVIAEYAHSNNQSLVLGQQTGDAYRFEVEGTITPSLQGRAYYRQADTGFANNATISFVPGQTRYGAELKAQVGSSTTLSLGYDSEKNQGNAPQAIVSLGDLLASPDQPLPGQPVDNQLTSITAGIQQRLGAAKFNLDWVHRDRKDRLNPSRSSTSSQLRSRFDLPLNRKLSLSALNETTLSSRSDAVYSDRTQIGLAYKLFPGISLGVNQHWFTRGQFSGQSFTTVDLGGDYQLFDQTTLTGRYGIVSGLNGLQGQGAVGLKHRWEITEGLNLNVGYERFVGNLFGKTAAGDRTEQPILVGSNSSTLGVRDGSSFNLGLEYVANPNWKASTRYERSDSTRSSNYNLNAALTGKLSPSLTGLVRFERTQNNNLSRLRRSEARQGREDLDATTEFRLGLAYRNIAADQFNALLRYEYRRNPSFIPETLLLGNGTGSTEHIFGAEAIYAPAWNWELYGKFALRHSESFLAEDLAGRSTTTLGQLRATYRLRNSFEFTGEARWLGQSGGFSETGFVLEGGYYLTPDLRLRAGYVFGEVSDRDFDGVQSASGPYFGVTVKINELFAGFGDQSPTPE